MNKEMSMSLNNRYDFVLLFDVKDGNPNGDPDAGNSPRVDDETGQGLVTDVCLKRKVRNFVGIVKGEQPPFEIYVKEKAILNKQHERAYQSIGAAGLLEGESKKRKGGDKVSEARDWMCKNFYDVRTFGAVMSTGVDGCGQVRGPVQLTFARSVDPVVTQEHIITRMAVTNEKDLKKERAMGRKFTIPYGLYVAHGFVSAHLANQTGFNEDDLALLWQALKEMFEHDRSAARGEMATRGLYVFKHEQPLGNARAHELFKLIQPEPIQPRLIQPKPKDAEVVPVPPRNFSEYTVSVDETNLPQGVTMMRLVG